MKGSGFKASLGLCVEFISKCFTLTMLLSPQKYILVWKLDGCQRVVCYGPATPPKRGWGGGEGSCGPLDFLHLTLKL